jgi:serine/threonine protein kinase
LGATLYHLLTGHAPCEAENVGEVLRKVLAGDIRRPRSLNPRIGPALEAICLKALALKPEDRYDSAGALKADLERWLADEPVLAWREPLSIRVSRWSRCHRIAVSVVVACSLTALLFLWVATVRAERQARIVANYEIAAEALVDMIDTVADLDGLTNVVSPQPPLPVPTTGVPPFIPVDTQQQLEALQHRFKTIKSGLESGGQDQMAMRIDGIIKRYNARVKQQFSAPYSLGAVTPTTGPGFGGALGSAAKSFPMIGD